MLSFIARRLLLMIPTTLGIALVVFSLYHAAPGDPATVMMGSGGAGPLGQDSDVESKVDAFRRKHSLDRSLPVQFFNYIGPFNLTRDGHAWFSTPYTERKVEEHELAGGETVKVGKALKIEHLPTTAVEERELLDAAVAATSSGEGTGVEAALIKDAGAGGLPPIFSALAERHRGVRTNRKADEVKRLLALLGEVTGAAPVVSEEVELVGKIEVWFAWYYTEGGGDRVQNTGEDPWGGLLALDLGKEMQKKTPVGEELKRRLAVTVPLSLVAVLLSYLLAIPLGILSVRKQGTKLDVIVTVKLFILYSIPSFWAGLMLILLFGKTGLDLLPVIGLHDKDAAMLDGWAYAWDTIKHCILPIATMTYGTLAYLSRQMRSGMLDVIRQDYIRTARAKGLSETKVVYKHALRNSLIPIITLFASVLPVLVGGSIIIEKVFDIPGMGKYAFEGLLRRDFYIIMPVTIFVGVMTQFGILLSDITYSLVDPRIRHT